MSILKSIVQSLVISYAPAQQQAPPPITPAPPVTEFKFLYHPVIDDPKFNALFKGRTCYDSLFDRSHIFRPPEKAVAYVDVLCYGTVDITVGELNKEGGGGAVWIVNEETQASKELQEKYADLRVILRGTPEANEIKDEFDKLKEYRKNGTTPLVR